jgi:acyl-CoA reductase-like NAD-dependent aldehyde dehydrogenase
MEAGLPAGVVTVVTDGREGGAMRKLVQREEVDKVAYAGTTRVRCKKKIAKIFR